MNKLVPLGVALLAVGFASVAVLAAGTPRAVNHENLTAASSSAEQVGEAKQANQANQTGDQGPKGEADGANNQTGDQGAKGEADGANNQTGQTAPPPTK